MLTLWSGWKFFFKNMSLTAVLLVCGPALAQTQPKIIPPSKQPVIWDGSNAILSISHQSAGGSYEKVVKTEGVSGNAVRAVNLPPAAISRDWFNGKLYAFGFTVEREEKTNKLPKVTHLLWVRENGGWTIDATFDASSVVTTDIMPLNNQRYLVCAARPFIEDENGAYLFGIYKKNSKNQLVLESPIANAFSKPFWIKDSQGEYVDTYGLGSNFIDALICRTEARIVAYIHKYGLFFIFSPEDGKLLKKAAIFPEINEEALLEKKSFGPVDLGIAPIIEPTKDGKIICATMSKEFVVLAMEVFPEPTMYDLGIPKAEFEKPENIEKLWNLSREIKAKRLKKWPEIVWWEFDPETGKSIKMPTPSGFPDKAEEGSVNLKWRIRADGTLAKVDQYSNIIEPEKKPRKFLGLFELK
jgi:hypothetical protein